MILTLTWQTIGTALLIFLVRVLGISMDTLRFMLTMRGKQAIAWIQGMDGPVLISDLVVRRKEIPAVEKIALETDHEAFITIEDITPLRSGYWGRGGAR